MVKRKKATESVLEQTINTAVQEDQAISEPIITEEKIEEAPTVTKVQFPQLNLEEQPKQSLAGDIFNNIPVSVSVELGRVKVSLKEIYELSEGYIIELDRLVGEPLDLVVNGQTIAQGEVVAIDNNYGLRLTSIIAKPNK